MYFGLREMKVADINMFSLLLANIALILRFIIYYQMDTIINNVNNKYHKVNNNINKIFSIQ